MLKTWPSNARGVGLIPGQGAKILHTSWPRNQNQNRSNIVTNSIKTLKMVHIRSKSDSDGETLYDIPYMWNLK